MNASTPFTRAARLMALLLIAALTSITFWSPAGSAQSGKSSEKRSKPSAKRSKIEGAVRLARLVRTDLTNSTRLGTPLLTTGTLPAPYTTVDGYTFVWSQGIFMGRGYATGTNLITKYQKIYDLGVMVSDGVVMGDGVIVSDGATAWALTVISEGDNTAGMALAPEDGTVP